MDDSRQAGRAEILETKTNDLAFPLQGKGSQRSRGWHSKSLSAAHVENRPMKITFELAAPQCPFVQRNGSVAAFIFHRVNLAIDIAKEDRYASMLKGPHLSLPQARDIDLQDLIRHDYSPPGP